MSLAEDLRGEAECDDVLSDTAAILTKAADRIGELEAMLGRVLQGYTDTMYYDSKLVDEAEALLKQ